MRYSPLLPFSFYKTSEALLCRYDEIIYMHGGRIVEQGSFTELKAAKGVYTIVD